MKRLVGYCIAACLVLHAHDALAHEAHKPTAAKDAISRQVHPWGQEGDPRKATRTITVDMADTMRFDPAQVDLKKGETVRFVVRNSGKLMHEMVIGTEAELAKHADMMKKMPDMHHDEPYMAHVKPGATEEITWTFTRPGTFHYGCLQPGHWEAGMKGRIVVAPN
jgi:uncharacterized cupredoxin-like copper-binding protein